MSFEKTALLYTNNYCFGTLVYYLVRFQKYIYIYSVLNGFIYTVLRNCLSVIYKKINKQITGPALNSFVCFSFTSSGYFCKRIKDGFLCSMYPSKCIHPKSDTDRYIFKRVED